MVDSLSLHGRDGPLQIPLDVNFCSTLGLWAAVSPGGQGVSTLPVFRISPSPTAARFPKTSASHTDSASTGTVVDLLAEIQKQRRVPWLVLWDSAPVHYCGATIAEVREKFLRDDKRLTATAQEPWSRTSRQKPDLTKQVCFQATLGGGPICCCGGAHDRAPRDRLEALEGAARCGVPAEA